MSEYIRNFAMVLVIIITAIGLVIAKIEGEESAMPQESIYQVEWIEVNPPPGVEGPCWAILDNGFSGVWCK